jgi:membrane-associated phospholipid phosphatase
MDRTSGTATAPGPTASRPGHPVRPFLVPGVALIVLIVLTVNVLLHGPLVTIDERIRRTVQGWALSASWRWLGDSPHAPAQLIADLGRETVAVPVLAVTAVVLAVRQRSLRPLLAAAAGVALLLAIVIPAKIIIARPGPGLSGVPAGGLGYFPSGHTCTACVCYSIAVFLLIAGQAGWIRRAALAGLAAVWLLVGAALVWCDYHWTTDVLAGWALSALIVWLALRARLPGRRSPAGRAARAGLRIPYPR